MAQAGSLSLHNNLFFLNKSGGNQLQCSVCECWLPSAAEKFVSSHVNGRKHKQQVHRKKEKERKLQCSVFVKGFDPLMIGLEKELHTYFLSLGVEVVDVYVDKNSTLYAIVEFSAASEVKKVLECQRALFHGKKLVVRRREVSKNDEATATLETNPITDIDSCLLPKDLKPLLVMKSEAAEQMEILKEFFQLSKGDVELRQLICDLLKNALEEVYPDCDVLLFGSSANGLGEQGSDIDMTLIVKGLEISEELFTDIRELVQRFVPGCKNVSIVHSQKTCSVVKFVHTDSQLSVDLSVNNHLALRNTALINSYMTCDTRVASIMFTVRKLAKCFGLSGGRSSCEVNPYALTLMVIHYLQNMQPPVLPCLQKCHETAEYQVSQWNCAYCSNCSDEFRSSNKMSVAALLSGFFHFYSVYDYKSNGICIHRSSVTTRDAICDEVNKFQLGDASNEFRFSSPLIVQDPFKLTHNLTHNVSEDGLVKLTNEFKRFAPLCEEFSLGKINLTDLFTENMKCTKREKQRLKRSRSNAYTVSLSNCKHTCSSSNQLCFDFVRNMLEIELRMRLSDINTPGDETFDRNAGNNVAVSGSSLSSSPYNCVEERVDVKTDGDLSSLKRTNDEAVCAQPTKRVKLCDQKSTCYIATAYIDTWTKRRKQRRLIQKLQTPNDPVNENCTIEEQDDADSGITQDIGTYSCFDKTSELTATGTPILCVKVDMMKSVDGNEVCKLKLEPFDGSSNVADFQTFFCYVKKQLISVFK